MSVFHQDANLSARGRKLVLQALLTCDMFGSEELKPTQSFHLLAGGTWINVSIITFK